MDREDPVSDTVRGRIERTGGNERRESFGLLRGGFDIIECFRKTELEVDERISCVFVTEEGEKVEVTSSERRREKCVGWHDEFPCELSVGETIRRRGWDRCKIGWKRRETLLKGG